MGCSRTHLSRRALLRLGFLATGGVVGSVAGGRFPPPLWAAASKRGSDTPPWSLGPAPSLPEVLVPQGADARVVARSGEPPVRGIAYRWHGAPDGGAVFPHPRSGWVYVSNSELPDGAGGVGVLHFDASGTPVNAYPILKGTSRNCAGGATPWGSWLSCEEVPRGQVWECDPLGGKFPRPLPALGRFSHEAAAVDPEGRAIYLTEDLDDGLLYRFTPGLWPNFTEGVLEAAAVDKAGRVTWHAVPDPSGASRPTRFQVPAATRFRGGEGIVHAGHAVTFATKFDDRIWRYDTAARTLSVLYDAAAHPDPILRGVDNLVHSPKGLVLVAEDGDDQQIVALTPSGTLFPVVQLVGHGQSELTGPAFDPSGTRLYFSSQRGTSGDPAGGMTFEVSGLPPL